ncbi:MAG: hypothetical protein GY789_02570 [Hyphomicrobiales bacterium]|nr:hypothetical protein [Hyphomicrobiales bacterium]MCP4997853.1 hypothetical protein [Hyphomicrobiales bacterium]
MPKRTIIAAILILSTLWSTQSFARWTQWYNLNNKKDYQALSHLINKQNRYRTVMKRVECKMEKGNIHIRIDNRSTFSGGYYYMTTGYGKNIEPQFKQAKKHGARTLSRSDVKTNRGLFTCIIWQKPQW